MIFLYAQNDAMIPVEWNVVNVALLIFSYVHATAYFLLIYIFWCAYYSNNCWNIASQYTNKMKLQAIAVYNPLSLFLSDENTLPCLALLFGSM